MSGPGRLYVLDHTGQIVNQWDADDWKLGNTPVIIDADHDGILDGYLGTRSKYLVRLNMRDLTPIARRANWMQCGCHTAAMDVDGDGRWDLFAGSDGDGSLEIVGMTFGSEVYCLDANGRFKWRSDLRPEFDEKVHAYMAPILCDLDGRPGLEILALTNGGYSNAPGPGHNAILFALSPTGEILDRFDVGGPRYWAKAFCANVDDDPYLELVASGSGGLGVVQTRGFGPHTEHFQRRRDYRRLSVLPWAYEDTYFIYRGHKQGLANGTDNLMLQQTIPSCTWSSPCGWSSCSPQRTRPPVPCSTNTAFRFPVNRLRRNRRHGKSYCFRQPVFSLSSTSDGGPPSWTTSR